METRITSGEDDLTVTVEEDSEATGKDAKPRFLSRAWWKSLFTAMKLHKYTARDWGIWNLSTLSTYGVIFGIFKPVAMFVATKAPWLVTRLSPPLGL